ncbi:hypothetical protein [Sulfurihydrogenibium yellowstonense]|jgi:hypothetical protein|uniref:Uncharacterized protein n=1 Tax=Sulfurihydrogenibium yellowstonense SS-5 TaxID=432331 RepID=C4FJP4_9AQUI|nr:hypothetical protein [Sulfurihydrogenibium yellowstonense]EEP60701.1 hypothetical protein SULYE_0793 [Sulfurihydrogenibium yellowstonense SS-5]
MKNLSFEGLLTLSFSLFLQFLIAVFLYLIYKDAKEIERKFFKWLLIVYIFWELFHVGYNVLLLATNW